MIYAQLEKNPFRFVSKVFSVHYCTEK